MSRNPTAQKVEADSTAYVDDPGLTHAKRVHAVETGLTRTNAGMAWAAGWVAGLCFGAPEIVNRVAYAVHGTPVAGRESPRMWAFLPAMGSSDSQIPELEQTKANVQADLVFDGNADRFGTQPRPEEADSARRTPAAGKRSALAGRSPGRALWLRMTHVGQR